MSTRPNPGSGEWGDGATWRHRLRGPVLACLALALVVRAAPAREIALDVRFAPALVRALLLERIFTGPERTFLAWRDVSGCNQLVLRDPRVDVHGDRLRITGAGEARVATPVAGQCLAFARWSGLVETEHELEVPAVRTRASLRIVDSRLLDESGQPTMLAGTVWDWVKAHVHSRLDGVELDLAPALQDLRAVLPLVLSGAGVERARAIVDSAAIDLAGVDDDGVVLVLRLDVPEVPAPTDASPEPPLSTAEMAAWDDAWRRWDAFVTFVVKRAAIDAGVPSLRAALRDVLIEARHDVAEVLAGAVPPGRDADEAVRALFQRTWQRLAPVLREVEATQPGEHALRYLAFITAADALRAIDALGPGAGLDLSADGLRRLARIVAPGTQDDPLSRGDAVDAELRRALGFGAPIPEPVRPDDGVMLPGWLRGVLPREARAGDEDVAALSVRLAGRVATRENVDEYLPLALRLLDATARTAAASHPVPPAHGREYRDALLATAWQESCWRQFVHDGGSVRALRSPAGAVGIMQVNETVWRGFYSRQRLADHIGYNARAGAEILAHYLVDHAMAKGVGERDGDTYELARAAYAAYHGGPGALRRFRERKASVRARAIVAAFAAKLERIRAGDDLAVMECFVGARAAD